MLFFNLERNEASNKSLDERQVRYQLGTGLLELSLLNL
jgi:hypothetical protein